MSNLATEGAAIRSLTDLGDYRIGIANALPDAVHGNNAIEILRVTGGFNTEGCRESPNRLSPSIT
jgi:hypothetical protein